jgi:hypothetical protein
VKPFPVLDREESWLVRATVPIVSPVRVIPQVAMYAVWS